MRLCLTLVWRANVADVAAVHHVRDVVVAAEYWSVGREEVWGEAILGLEGRVHPGPCLPQYWLSRHLAAVNLGTKECSRWPSPCRCYKFRSMHAGCESRAHHICMGEDSLAVAGRLDGSLQLVVALTIWQPKGIQELGGHIDDVQIRTGCSQRKQRMLAASNVHLAAIRLLS